MRRADDFDDFWRAPVGRYAVARSFLLFCGREDFCGYVMWGELTEADIRAITSSVFHPAWRELPPHRTLVDLRGVTAIDASAFSALRATQTEHRAELSHRITRMAIVRPDGFIGAIAEGIANVVSFPHPVQVVPTTEAALAALDVTEPQFAGELDAARASLQPRAQIVGELQALFATQPRDLALATAAKLLGVSARNLQRKLREAGTTFLGERNLAQVQTAQRLMLETDATLSQIALDVGCGSLQHFSALFRRVTGRTPSEWRADHKR